MPDDTIDHGDTTRPRINFVDLDNALHGVREADTLDELTRAEYDRIKALPTDKKHRPSKADKAAEKFHADHEQLRSDIAADLASRGIDPESPDAHEYFEQLHALAGD